MLKFKLTEIPEGDSHVDLTLDSDSLDLGDVQVKEGSLAFDFHKNIHYIQVDFTVRVITELVCDRSLESFDYPVETSYEVIFKAEPTEEKSDEDGAVRNIDYVGNIIDLEEDVRDTILLNIPIKKIHPRFLDEDGEISDFVDKEFGKSDDDEDAIDPRWEALKKLKK